jgi:hypothetical protein
MSSCELPVILVSILIKLEFSREVFEKYASVKFRKSFQWGPIFSMQIDGQTDRQTDMTKLIVAFRNFVKDSQRHIHSNNCQCQYNLIY